MTRRGLGRTPVTLSIGAAAGYAPNAFVPGSLAVAIPLTAAHVDFSAMPQLAGQWWNAADERGGDDRIEGG